MYYYYVALYYTFNEVLVCINDHSVHLYGSVTRLTELDFCGLHMGAWKSLCCKNDLCNGITTLWFICMPHRYIRSCPGRLKIYVNHSIHYMVWESCCSHFLFSKVWHMYTPLFMLFNLLYFSFLELLLHWVECKPSRAEKNVPVRQA